MCLNIKKIVCRLWLRKLFTRAQPGYAAATHLIPGGGGVRPLQQGGEWRRVVGARIVKWLRGRKKGPKNTQTDKNKLTRKTHQNGILLQLMCCVGWLGHLVGRTRVVVGGGQFDCRWGGAGFTPAVGATR